MCGKQAYTVKQPSSWFGSCILSLIRLSFFLLPLRQGEKLGVPINEEKLSRQKRVPYKLAIGKIMNGLLSKSSSTIVLPLGQKTGPGAIVPQYICSIASSGCRLLLKL
jgi:hypothetical protein